ncbi:MAG: large subunit ribosomal protein L22 [Parcubacteria group bacterium Athens0714_24]|nr:MAG: large subunit ribosomal protein L22 [Parcubacteria group bacterium Athens0714_24]
MSEITAKLNYYRMAPRKVRLIVDLVRGKNLQDSFAQLKFSPNKASSVIAKLLKSAFSNAKNNFKIKDPEKLFIKKITVDDGPTLKRYMPRARGSVSPIRKRTSHISVILSNHE